VVGPLTDLVDNSVNQLTGAVGEMVDQIPGALNDVAGSLPDPSDIDVNQITQAVGDVGDALGDLVANGTSEANAVLDDVVGSPDYSNLLGPLGQLAQNSISQVGDPTSEVLSSLGDTTAIQTTENPIDGEQGPSTELGENLGSTSADGEAAAALGGEDSASTELTSAEQPTDAVSSGTIDVPEVSPDTTATDVLFTSGQYTDYNVALQSDDGRDAGEVVDQLTSEQDANASDLPSHADTSADQNSNLLPQGDDDSTLVPQPSTAEDLGLRDYSI
jgi:hypothetical protein